ncbi:MAG: LPS-assembly protein LptD [Gemmatimonadaceae bacterium]|nr:LPS-assembly protein LptD [Gemmatimonadaceae bacterium]
MCAFVATGALGAQQVPVKPTPGTQPPVKPPVSAPKSMPVRKTAGGRLDDSLAKRAPAVLTFDWEPADSVMREMLDRPGFRRVQYQGGRVVFDAKTRELVLKGKPSAVKRDETMLVGDSITYNDSTKRVIALGDTVWLRDPGRSQSDDFIARGRIDYDLESRSGQTGAFSTSVESGQKLYLTAQRGSIFTDTLVSGKHIVYAKDGSFTYCDHEEPHFHFTTHDMKFVSENVMVARPGILYIGEVPVFWIPFFFQDVRSGRRSGMLTPNFGIAELFRNSPSYRRSVTNMGYFFALNDYMNAEASFDWRSGARSTSSDPGFVRGNVEYRYRWLDRFISGETAVSYLAQRNGSSNTSITWNHNQDFSKQTRLTSRINLVQNTQIQRATTINPVAANATIRSDLSYQTKVGVAQINLGGNRTQYPGRTQVEMTFPSLSVSTGTLGKGLVSWTPAVRVSVSQTQRIDQGLQFPFVYNANSVTGGIDSSRFRADRRTMTAGFETPIKIGNFVWQNSFAMNEYVNDYPEQREIIGVRDTSQRSTRVFAKTFKTDADWTTSVGLPGFFHGSWNVSPSVQVSNVDPGSGMWVRTERSGGTWVSQSKRLSYAVSASPTIYGFLPGFGLVSRIRHTIAPSLSYSYSPEASVSDAYLSALGRTRVGYLGSLKQNRVSVNLSTLFEAKLKAEADSNPESGKKVKLLSLNFSPLTYDFVRADTGNGFTDRTFSISGRTDLLPGLDFRTSYELFQGDPISDTATFSPYRTDVGVSFSMDGKSALVGLLGRLLGLRSNIELDPAKARPGPNADGSVIGQSRQMNAAGSGSRGVQQLSLPSGQGWRMSLQYNASRQRPPSGGTQIVNDPTTLCAAQKAFGLAAYDRCIFLAQNAPPTGLTSGQGAIGAPVYISPPTQNVTGSMSFNITPKWAAQWSTQYDVTRSRFASQQIGLQREMHDWNAVFSFTQAPNGNFAFNFFIALKAQPELKFNYDRQTYRSSGF